MNALVKEWIQKAEGDFNSALREYRARKLPNYDAAGLHAQQSIEKYLKALLQLHNLPFQKTHDLLALMELCLPIMPELELYRELFAYLNPFAVTFRYPGEFVTKRQAKEAVKALKILWPILRSKLSLSTE